MKQLRQGSHNPSPAPVYTRARARVSNFQNNGDNGYRVLFSGQIHAVSETSVRMYRVSLGLRGLKGLKDPEREK